MLEQDFEKRAVLVIFSVYSPYPASGFVVYCFVGLQTAFYIEAKPRGRSGQGRFQYIRIDTQVC